MRSSKWGQAAWFVQEGRLLLLQRAAAPWQGGWNLPAGYVEADEDPRRAAERETLEETGLKIRAGVLVNAYYYQDDHRGSGVFLLYEGGSPEGTLVSTPEALQARFFGPSEIPTSLAGGGHDQAIQAWQQNCSAGEGTSMSSPIPFDPQTWNASIASLPYAHVLQTWEWAQVKQRNGWQPQPLRWEGGAGVLLQRSIPAGGFAARLRVLYIPKGPLIDWADATLRRQVLTDLRQVARRQGAIFIKIDPDLPLGTGFPGTPEAAPFPPGEATLADLKALGWRLSGEQIQFRNTVVIDLAPSEDELLGRMKQKTRYNINLARRKGVSHPPRQPRRTCPCFTRCTPETSLPRWLRDP